MSSSRQSGSSDGLGYVTSEKNMFNGITLHLKGHAQLRVDTSESFSLSTYFILIQKFFIFEWMPHSNNTDDEQETYLLVRTQIVEELKLKGMRRCWPGADIHS